MSLRRSSRLDFEITDCRDVEQKRTMRAVCRIPIYSTEKPSGNFVLPPFSHSCLVERSYIGVLPWCFGPPYPEASWTETINQNHAVLAITQDLCWHANTLSIEELRSAHRIAQLRLENALSAANTGIVDVRWFFRFRRLEFGRRFRGAYRLGQLRIREFNCTEPRPNGECHQCEAHCQ